MAIENCNKNSKSITEAININKNRLERDGKEQGVIP